AAHGIAHLAFARSLIQGGDVGVGFGGGRGGDIPNLRLSSKLETQAGAARKIAATEINGVAVRAEGKRLAGDQCGVAAVEFQCRRVYGRDGQRAGQGEARGGGVRMLIELHEASAVRTEDAEQVQVAIGADDVAVDRYLTRA